MNNINNVIKPVIDDRKKETGDDILPYTKLVFIRPFTVIDAYIARLPNKLGNISTSDIVGYDLPRAGEFSKLLVWMTYFTASTNQAKFAA